MIKKVIKMITKLKLSKTTFYILYFHLTLIPLDVEAKYTRELHVNEGENLVGPKSSRYRFVSDNIKKDRNRPEQGRSYRDYHEMRDEIITRYEEERPTLRQYKGRTYRKVNGEGLASNAKKFRDNSILIREQMERRNERVNQVGKQVVNGIGALGEVAIQETIESERSRTIISKLKDTFVHAFKGIFDY